MSTDQQRSSWARAAQEAGHGFEDSLRDLHHVYDAERRAWIVRQAAEVSYHMRGKIRVVTSIERVGADWGGMHRPSGVRLAFDSKTQRDGCSMGDLKRLATERQLQILDLMRTATCGVAFFFLHVREGRAAGYWIIPVTNSPAWIAVSQARVSSIPLLPSSQAAAWGVLRAPSIDWLSVLEQHDVGRAGWAWPHVVRRDPS